MRASDRLVSAQVLFSSFEEIQILARHSIPYVYVTCHLRIDYMHSILLSFRFDSFTATRVLSVKLPSGVTCLTHHRQEH